MGKGTANRFLAMLAALGLAACAVWLLYRVCRALTNLPLPS